MLNTNRLIPPLSQMTNIPKVDDLINKLDTGWYKKSIFYQFLSLKYIDFSSIHFYQYTSNRNAFLAERIPIGVYVFLATVVCD